jgi:hypothetical protein
MKTKERLENFKAMVESRPASSCYFEESDGTWRDWKDLSVEGKLAYISLDAARCDVPFPVFEEAVRMTVEDTEDAAIRLLHNVRQELHELAELLPDSSGTESTPLADRLREALNRESGPIAKEPELDRD